MIGDVVEHNDTCSRIIVFKTFAVNFFVASRYSHMDVFKLLVKHRADLEKKSRVQQQTPLHVAVSHGQGAHGTTVDFCRRGRDWGCWHYVVIVFLVVIRILLIGRRGGGIAAATRQQCELGKSQWCVVCGTGSQAAPQTQAIPRTRR